MIGRPLPEAGVAKREGGRERQGEEKKRNVPQTICFKMRQE